MRVFLLLGLLLFTTLFSNETDFADENQSSVSFHMPTQKVLYLSYKELPKRVLKGEIFSVTLKTLSTIKDFTDITYELSNYRGLELINDIPYREENSKYYYDTFYFLTTGSYVRLPDFTATLIDETNTQYKNTQLPGEELNVVTLNPKKNFSNIIADSFELVEYKTTSYDNQHNIIVFIAQATNCNIKALNLDGVYKQGIESVTESNFDSKIIYYAVLDKDLENLSFSYFNLLRNRFELINIPIIVDDDSVTTQSDLKPKDQSRERIKMMIAAAVALVGLVFILWRRKYIYLFLVLIPLGYIAYSGIPSKDVCIKEGSPIYLLPVNNGTIFETTHSRYYLPKEGSVKEFTKVKLKNEKIGWVKNEDICSY
ncbi:hypothetical protein KJ877_02010 [bacterium]|nr:hypothetical protein [bacterium]MBU1990294.1 hypothetical protein [bacterium]